LRVWDVEGGRELRTLQIPASVHGVALSRDARYAVSASDDHILRVWDIYQGSVIATFACEGAVLCCAVFDSNIIVAGDLGGRVYCLELVF